MRITRGDLWMGNTPGAELVQAAQGGNTPAREELFRQHVQMVHALSFRLAGRFADPAEITQESFRRALASLGQLAHPEALRPWLAGVVAQVVHEVIAGRHLAYRFGWRRLRAPWFDVALGGQGRVIGGVDARRLYVLADRMPLRMRTAFLLHHVDRMGLPDIAVALETSVSWVRTTVRAAERRAGLRGRFV